VPSDDLHTLVTAEFGISADYIPSDLVNIANYFPLQVTRGYDTRIRRVALEPLIRMIIDMQRVGLQPEIISGYRSFSAQAITWAKWLEREPDRAAIISVPPGHSEHQLGTTIDFGSPELADIIGEEDVDFHTYFYKTSEGIWLAEHAHEYGFTLSYPLDSLEITGFYYEPWHYRYIGAELATQLHEINLSLTQYLLETYPPPCFP
jgi:D-alanyl-D-alanine carboxypeptidase